MTAPQTIPHEVLARQYEASDPKTSAWVSANAGSGKTFVLAQRVIRLLLGGTDPAKILCLTFTKAAAANMAKTVFDRLAQWTALDDAALDEEIRKLSNERPDAKLRALARRLFALALETPGGLKVQTIHAFCTRLLQQFPFEAQVAARFEVLDDAAQSALLESTSMGVLLDAAAAPDSALGRALATAIAAASDQSFRNVVNEAIGKRDLLLAWSEHAGSLDAAITELCGTLAIAPDDSIERVEMEMVEGPHLPTAKWAAAAKFLRTGSKSDCDQAARLEAALAATGGERVERYLEIFLTKSFEPRKNLLTKGLYERAPASGDKLYQERTRLLELFARRKAVACRDRTAAMLTVAAAVIARYQAEKARRGLLDYDDLIDKARALLAHQGAAWVHYKLDLGIDHVLIDEAQDTSPKQWDVIERLVAEFAAGAGARGSLVRSVFAVGDDKQSIFSFQGAAPAAFAQKRDDFRRSYDESGIAFRPLEFKYSFRSTQVVLDAVDHVFRQPAAFRGLTADPEPTVHTAVRAQAPGLVEIWPLIEPDERVQVEGWDAPFDTTSEKSPRVQLARRIAAHVGRLIARGERVGDGDKRRALTPGDVLILVRQRGPLFEAIIRALKNAGIAVAGADRLILTEHIAVMDLLALADAVLLPADELALATVLKSPLFGLDEELLYKLAFGRRGSLRATLRARAAEPEFADAAARFERLAAAARRESPFAFYARVLGPERGRRRFLARIGAEATDALDEFLNLALDYERRETPSLQGFVAWLRSANAEVKRDMEIARNEVRVMTVHGAKGLEAPLVILADTTTPPQGYPLHQPRLFTLAREGAAATAPEHLVWSARRDDDVAVVATARAAALSAAEDEYRRLLYVAMTRAADRLIVCGATTLRGKPAGCWYDLVADALQPPISVVEPADDGDGEVLRYRKAPLESFAATPAEATATPPPALPDWLERNAPAEAPATVPVSPSSAYDEVTPPRGGTGLSRKKALARGNVVHRLLQSLPDLPAEARAEAARRHLARRAEFDADEQATLAESVHAILDDARFATLFGANSRAEVPIVGRIPRSGQPPLAVAGQIDRLVVTAQEVLIADYKTNTPAPSRIEDVPPAYVAQLALYRAVLAALYPGKPIRAALVWTEVPDLMEISDDALGAALARLTAG